MFQGISVSVESLAVKMAVFFVFGYCSEGFPISLENCFTVLYTAETNRANEAISIRQLTPPYWGRLQIGIKESER